MSKQFTTLEEAGYIAIERHVGEKRRRVRVPLTKTGRGAFDGHVAARNGILTSADSAAPRCSGVRTYLTPSDDRHSVDLLVAAPLTCVYGPVA